jgi:hypothetical protein
MTTVIKWWKRTRIWGKLRDTFAVLGTGTTIGLEATDVGGFWAYVVATATLTGTIAGIWMSDENQDGIADIFQDHTQKP